MCPEDDSQESRLRRVGLVSPGWPPASYSNGIVTYVAAIRAGLGILGIDSCVFAIQADETDRSRDVIDIRRFKPALVSRLARRASEFVTRKPGLAWRLGLGVGAAVRGTHRFTPLDLVEMEESFGAAWYAQRACPLPMVVRLHGPWIVVAPAMGIARDAACLMRERLEGRAIMRADGVSSPSRYSLARVREHYGIELPEAEVIPNPVLMPAPRERWSLEACDRKSILFVGRFDRLKGGDVVIDAFKTVAQEHPAAELIFVGPDRGLAGSPGRVQHFTEYLSECLPPAQAGRVRMLGHQPPSTIRELRRKAVVTVVASRFENFPMTALEAQSFGSPLVASNVGGIPEIVTSEEDGLLFESGDPADLARKVLRLLGDPGLAERIGRQAARNAAERFAPEVVARQTSAFYGRVLRRNHLDDDRQRRSYFFR